MEKIGHFFYIHLPIHLYKADDIQLIFLLGKLGSNVIYDNRIPLKAAATAVSLGGGGQFRLKQLLLLCLWWGGGGGGGGGERENSA